MITFLKFIFTFLVILPMTILFMVGAGMSTLPSSTAMVVISLVAVVALIIRLLMEND